MRTRERQTNRNEGTKVRSRLNLRGAGGMLCNVVSAWGVCSTDEGRDQSSGGRGSVVCVVRADSEEECSKDSRKLYSPGSWSPPGTGERGCVVSGMVMVCYEKSNWICIAIRLCQSPKKINSTKK